MTNKQQNNDEPLLDLTTERVPKYIQIDGKEYKLKAMEDMSLTEQSEFQSYGKTCERVGSHKGKFTEAVEKEYNKVLLDFLIMILPDAGRKVFGKLTIWQRLQVVEVFMVETRRLREGKSPGYKGPLTPLSGVKKKKLTGEK